jgi:hypothetical protein
MPDNLLFTFTQEPQTDTFWKTVELPFQTDDQNFQFVNPVAAAEWFAKKTSDISFLNGLAEILEEEIANLKVHLRRKDEEIGRLRRRLLANAYDRIAKSAGTEILNSFVLKLAEDDSKGPQLAKMEEEKEELVRSIEVREPRRNQLYARLKAIRDAQDAARQYLDYNKLEQRLNAGGRV